MGIEIQNIHVSIVLSDIKINKKVKRSQHKNNTSQWITIIIIIRIMKIVHKKIRQVKYYFIFLKTIDNDANRMCMRRKKK